MSDRWRNARRRVLRKLADRRTRRQVLLVLVTLLAIGSLAAVKGLIGYYVFSAGTSRFEVALIVAAAVAAVFALGERKVATALEARFNRNTRKHREALAALRDELAETASRAELERNLVARFDELFATRGTVLYIDDGTKYAVAASSAPSPSPVAHDDPLAVVLRERHAPVVPSEHGSSIAAPLAWPLRSRGNLIGILAAGEHDYLESFDTSEIEAVEALADAAAANLVLLDSSLTAHLVKTPTNLPPAAGSFVGRERELAECRTLLAQVRLLTVTGFGGAGKTCLARRLAEEALVTHRGGVWWVDLAAVTDDAHVPSALATAIGVADAAEIAHHLGNEPVLVVLDTCEHVRAGCAALAVRLLRECPRVTILATSQSPMGVAGERDFALAPLALPATDDDPQALAQCDAVRLFIERAQAVVPGFSAGPQELADIAAIVRQLDGIPLAVELAAARLRLLSLAAIRAHLAESLRLLGGGDAAQARHETMRASLAWSYDPLAQAEQRLLRRLSVFAHGFTLDAAARVAADAGDGLDILDPVGRLVQASLLMVVREGAGEPRYHMPETLRQFAQERLAQDPDAAQVRERHARYYVDLASHERGRLDRESANLAAAHRWLMASDCGDTALAFAHSLAPYFRERGFLARGIAQLREALTHPHATDNALRAAVLFAVADLEQAADDHASALAHLAQAKPLANAALACRIVGREAVSLQQSGDTQRARRIAEQALADARALRNAPVLREVLDDAAEVFAAANELDAAAAFADESLVLARADAETDGLAIALRDAARVALDRGDTPRARDLLADAIDAAGDGELGGESDLALAVAIANRERDWARAARYAGAADAAASRADKRRSAVPAADLDAGRAALGGVAYGVAFEAGHRLELAQALRDAHDWLRPPAPSV